MLSTLFDTAGPRPSCPTRPRSLLCASQTAISAAFRAGVSGRQSRPGRPGTNANAPSAEEGPRTPPVKLLGILREEALRQAPLVSRLSAACELLQPPERRLQQQLLQPLLEVLEEALGGNINAHLQSVSFVAMRVPPQFRLFFCQAISLCCSFASSRRRSAYHCLRQRDAGPYGQPRARPPL